MDFFESVSNVLEAGRDAALVSITGSMGSTPRESGAKMCVLDDGAIFGTVGGGAIEYQCIQRAKRVIKEKLAFSEGFSLTHSDKADIGMICGGSVNVCFQYISGLDEGTRALFARTAALSRANMDSWLITRIVRGCAERTFIYDEERGFEFADESDTRLKRIELSPLARVCEIDGAEYYSEPLGRRGCAYVFGGGHVSQELAATIARVGFRPVIYEDRAEFADPALFMGAQTILAPFGEAGDRLAVTDRDYIIIMTRGHQNDFELIAWALRTSAAYIGVIGSRKKIASTNERLRTLGFDENDFARVHTPIGLPILAETPAEIAVSIAAELIEHRARLRREQA